MLENQSLVLDLLEWVGKRQRSYDEVMEAWRTSCPRLPIWEDACDHGLVVREYQQDGSMTVRLTETGHRLLISERSAQLDLTKTP